MAYFTEKFTDSAYAGDTIHATVDGFDIVATIHLDDRGEAPWESDDGHGPVSDWRRYDSKAPGELILSTDGWNCRSARFYDYAEACRIARRDRWGTSDGQRDGESDRHYAARAALADYERLRRWCYDDWCYVGVSVTVSRGAVTLVDQFECALWGIESDAGEHLTETAGELADEAMDLARERIAELVAA